MKFHTGKYIWKFIHDLLVYKNVNQNWWPMFAITHVNECFTHLESFSLAKTTWKSEINICFSEFFEVFCHVGAETRTFHKVLSWMEKQRTAF